MTGEQDVLERETYDGTIVVAGQSFPISIQIFAGSDCCLRIDPVKLEPKLYVAIEKMSGRPGQLATLMSVDVVSGKGRRFVSDQVDSRGGGMDSHRLEVGLGVLSFESVSSSTPRPVLRKYLRGFEVYSLDLPTPLGRLHVFGPMRALSRDSVAGGIALEADTPSPEWRARAEDFLRHIMMGLMVADGGRLHAPVTEYFEDKKVEVTFVAGSSFARELPLHHHLNLEPIIQALIDRFFKQGPLDDILYTALGWTQIDTTIDEVRFTTAMTALEALISSQLKGQPGGLLTSEQFAPLLKEFRDAIDASSLGSELKAKMKDRVGNVNAASFAKNITKLIAHYGVSDADLDEKTIGRLVALRNRIVHDGVAPNNADLWQGIIFVRELVMRILMSEIGYVGPYNCYIGGLHTRLFPGCERPVTV